MSKLDPKSALKSLELIDRALATGNSSAIRATSAACMETFIDEIRNALKMVVLNIYEEKTDE